MKAKLLRPFTQRKGLSIYFSSDQKEARIFLRYELNSEEEPIIPAKEDHQQAMDNLWQHTCFELFCKKEGAQSYLEFNFSPSGHWNCYHFDRYREQMKKIELSANPIINYSHDHLSVEFIFPEQFMNYLEKLHPCAVIEYKDKKEYLAAEHLKDVPDFHAF